MLTLCSDTFACMSCDLTRPGVRRRARRHRRKLADLTCPDAALADPICGVETVGSAGYRKCSPGTYKPHTGYANCRKCPAGTYAASHGSCGCSSCPAGHALNSAQTQCGACVDWVLVGGAYQGCPCKTTMTFRAKKSAEGPPCMFNVR